MYNIEISAHTDIGDTKQTNQDCIFSKKDVLCGRDIGLYIVADGCGGMAYGEEISNLIVTHFARLWGNELKALLENPVVKDEEINALLENAIRDINDRALAFSRQIDSKAGSTLSLLLTVGRRFYIKNVGDSRVYLIRGNKMTQLTQDQSLVADMVRNGELSQEEAKNFKRKNVLTMCIGVFDVIRTYSNYGKIQKNDTFLLCCDGVHNLVPMEKMVEIVKNRRISFDAKAEAVRSAIAPGAANDNVSTIICKYGKNPSKIRKGLTIFLLVAAILCLLFVFLKGPIESYIERHIFDHEFTESEIRFDMDVKVNPEKQETEK